MLNKILAILFFILGLLLMTAGSDVSLFDALLIGTALFTAGYSVYTGTTHRVWGSFRNKILLSFAVFLLVILALVPHERYIATFTTLYSIGIYFVIQYWSREKVLLKELLIKGYITGALISSVLGAAAYLIRVSRLIEIPTWLFWQGDVRLSGFLDDPVVYGAFLVPALVILFYRFLYSEDYKKKTLYAAGLIVVYLNILVTGSRGAWINATIALGVYVLLDKGLRKKPKILSVAGVAAVFSLILYAVIFLMPIQGVTYYKATLESRKISSDAPRIQALGEAPNLITQRSAFNVIFGSGGGMYEVMSAQKLSPHNVYIKTVFEYGLVGLLLVLSFFAVLMKYLIKRMYTSDNAGAFIIPCALIIGILVHSIFVDTLHWRHLWILVALL